MAEEQFKRRIAYKLRIGRILEGKPIIENDRLNFIELHDKRIARVNIIANIVDKYNQEGEKKYLTYTIDDATGQIKIKIFGEDVDKFSKYNQGDTIAIIGMLRKWNNEIYITPEIIKKKDAKFLLIRKIEAELEEPKVLDKSKLSELKSKIITMVKESEKDGGVEIEKMIMELKERPESINNEIKKLLEEGAVYEPRPGKLRYLG